MGGQAAQPDLRHALTARAPHQAALDEALAHEAEGQRLLLAGDPAAAAPLRAAAVAYRASWEAAGPKAFGRLVGHVKAGILAGDGGDEAAYVLAALDDAPAGDSPVAAYARAVAALAAGRDDDVAGAVATMHAGGEAFARTADALGALGAGDGEAYDTALRAIVADFEARDAHLTGVAIADTAVLLDRLAAPRGLGGLPRSPVLPPA